MKFKPVRIIKRGENYQLYFYNPNGERRRISVGSDYQHAQKIAVRFNDWLLEGKDPEKEIAKTQQNENSRKITLRDFFPIFIQRHGKYQSENMQLVYKYRFDNISRCPQLADAPMESITKIVTHEYMQARIEKEGISNSTANREAALIKNMLFRAVEWGYISYNPLQGFKMLPEPKKREVDQTTEQISLLIEALPKPLDSMVEFMVYTGFRKETVLSLTIDAIRFHDLTPTGEVTLKVKGGRTEKFPLGEQAVRVLKSVIGKRHEGYVFISPRTGNRYKHINNTFDRVVRKLGLTVKETIGSTVKETKLRIHDLRHVHANWLFQAGVSKDAIGQLLGHKNLETTDRYITYDRFIFSDALNTLPQITRDVGENDSTQGIMYNNCHKLTQNA